MMASEEPISRVLIIGAGTMGTQIGAVFALGGLDVTVADVSADALVQGESEIRGRLQRMAETDRITPDHASASLARLAWESDMAAAAANADLVVEAATERVELKRQIFRDLAAHAPSHAIFTTNSSTIPSSMVADASGRPDRVCNLHFFNPALVMRCVEIVPNPHTSAHTVARVAALVKRIDKEAVLLHAETPGFIANRLMLALQNEAIALHADGVADIEDIDRAARLALGHPMGPFALMDLVGLDVIELIHRAKHEITGDPDDLPPASIVSRVAAVQLGRKTGRGWFSYDGAGRPVSVSSPKAQTAPA